MDLKNKILNHFQMSGVNNGLLQTCGRLWALVFNNKICICDIFRAFLIFDLTIRFLLNSSLLLLLVLFLSHFKPHWDIAKKQSNIIIKGLIHFNMTRLTSSFRKEFFKSVSKCWKQVSGASACSQGSGSEHQNSAAAAPLTSGAHGTPLAPDLCEEGCQG